MWTRENIERHLEESKAEEKKRGIVDMARVTCGRIWNSKTGKTLMLEKVTHYGN